MSDDIFENEDIDYENNQLAENEEVEYENDPKNNEYEEKRRLLEKTKITKQTWSILEIYQKINDGTLILDPSYQRREIWKRDKQSAFIESLFMGIVVPPIYVVENLGDDFLDEIKYEVVDGKQRLTSINCFIKNKLKLDPKSLEYFCDLYGNKTFSEIKDKYDVAMKEMLSQVLDVYVITANSPEFTKYDIFSRLNKGAVQLRVNEIRRAIYRSELLDIIDKYVEKHHQTPEYRAIFSDKIINRYEDYGKFYRGIASYINTDLDKRILQNYNSRPREMINKVLERFQTEMCLDETTVNKILDKTMYLLTEFKDFNATYFLDSCIRCAVDYSDKFDKALIEKIKIDPVIIETFKKSASTTKNVNKRISRIIDIMNGE